MHRRDFLAASAGLLVAGSRGRAAERGKRIAFLGTEVRRHSHAQHFLDRFTQGYTWKGSWQKPRIQVAAVYLDQFPQGDLGRQRIARHKLRQCSSIAETLTLGGSKLAVDGVVVIAEHGDYPRNEKGQTALPALQVVQGGGRRSLRRRATRCPSSTTSICRHPGTSVRKWWPMPSGSGFPSWPALRSRSRGDCRRSTCPSAPR